MCSIKSKHGWYKKTQIPLLEIKNIWNRNAQDEMKDRLDIADDKTSEFKDIVLETIQNVIEEQEKTSESCEKP